MQYRKETLEDLRKFIDDIQEQEIFLKSVSFDSNHKIKGIFTKATVERNFQIKETRISFGEKIPSPESQAGKSKEGEPIIDICYSFFLEDNLELENRKEKIQTVNLEYSIILTLDKNAEILQYSEERKKKVIEAFTKHSGLLIVLPYVRFIIDLLGRSSGLSLPPLPHIKIKGKEQEMI